MELNAFVFMLIQSAVFLAPLVMVFYRQGRKDQILERAVRDINGLGEKVKNTEDKNTQVLAELTAKINSMNNTLIRVVTSVEFIEKSVGVNKK